MAALPYMQLYIADYLADTLHLSTVEHGAYLLLLMNYWQTGKPLPDNDKRLANIAKLTLTEWMEHRDTLAEFFIVADGVWVQKRMEIDLDKVRAKSEKAQFAGRLSAVKRWGNTKVTDAITVDTKTLQRNGNHTDTEADTEADTDTEAKKKCSNEHSSTANPVDPPVVIETPSKADCPHQQIINLYHLICSELPPVNVWTNTNKANLRQRWLEDKDRQSLDWWREFLERVAESDFLMGRAKEFRANLGWLVGPKNFAKVCNGQYDNRAPHTGPFSPQNTAVAKRVLAMMENREEEE